MLRNPGAADDRPGARPRHSHRLIDNLAFTLSSTSNPSPHAIT